jgi:hypothetical protein
MSTYLGRCGEVEVEDEDEISFHLARETDQYNVP